MALTEQEEFELLSLEREKAMANQMTQIQQPQEVGNQTSSGQQMVETKDDLQKNLLRGLLLGGAGVAGYTAYRGGFTPKFEEITKNRIEQAKTKTNIGLLKNQLKDFQNQLGITGTEAEYIPKKLSELSGETQSKYSLLSEQTKKKFDVSLLNTKSALKDFDIKIRDAKVEDLSKTLEENFPKFLKSASLGYKAGMDAIEGFLAEKGISYSSLDVNQLLNKTIQEGIGRGMLPEELAPLNKLNEFITPKFGQEGTMLPERKINFSELKGYMSGFNKIDPEGKLSALVNKNWLDFLETNAPPEVKSQLTKLNQNYKQFAEARFQYSKIVGKSGEFNTKAANKYLLDYFNSNIDNGTQNLMNIISKGNDIVTGSPNVGEKFNELSGLKIPRKLLTEEIGITQRLKQEALDNLSKDAQEQISRIQIMKSKSNELLSKLRVEEEKVLGNKLNAIPRIIKNLSRLRKIGQLGGTALGIAPQVLDVIKFANDPQGYYYETITGERVSPKGSQDREIQFGRLI